ncbi:MAG: hypothetical protein R2819_11465 [Allomuricauda sp.]
MEDSALPAYHQSIFHQLFEHASDIDCKLLLLEQIWNWEIRRHPLLEELEASDNPKIRQRAVQVKDLLLQNLGMEVSGDDKLLPMNLCFLYDEFNISPTRVDRDLNMDFEVTLDIFNTDP